MQTDPAMHQMCTDGFTVEYVQVVCQIQGHAHGTTFKASAHGRLRSIAQVSLYQQFIYTQAKTVFEAPAGDIVDEILGLNGKIHRQSVVPVALFNDQTTPFYLKSSQTTTEYENQTLTKTSTDHIYSPDSTYVLFFMSSLPIVICNMKHYMVNASPHVCECIQMQQLNKQIR